MKVFDDLPNHELMQERLYVHKICIGLNEVASKIDTVYMVTLHDLLSNRNHTLAYLFPLLKEGKLKVKVQSHILRVPTPQDRLRFTYPFRDEPMYIAENEIVYNNPSSAEIAIADIRKRWTEVSVDFSEKPYSEQTALERQKNEAIHFFENFGVRIALPDGQFEL